MKNQEEIKKEIILNLSSYLDLTIKNFSNMDIQDKKFNLQVFCDMLSVLHRMEEADHDKGVRNNHTVD